VGKGGASVSALISGPLGKHPRRGRQRKSEVDVRAEQLEHGKDADHRTEDVDAVTD